MKTSQMTIFEVSKPGRIALDLANLPGAETVDDLLLVGALQTVLREAAQAADGALHPLLGGVGGCEDEVDVFG